MPSKSKAQQKFMGMVHALQKGDIKPSDVSQDVRDAAKSMKKKDAKDFASTSHKGLPRKVKQEILNRLKEYANKMGTDHLGGDDYTSSKKGGLRDNDGYEYESVQEGGIPQNWMSGRTSDYHTKLRGKEREYDDTNFDKENSGQPDIEESFASDLDMIKKDSKNLKDFIKKVLSDNDFRSLKGDRDFIKYLSSMYNESVQESFDKVEHLKLLNLALRTMPGSQKQKEIIRKLNKVRVAGGMRPLKETSIIEYASKLTLSYLPADEEEIEKMNEGIMIRRAVDIAQEILPKDTWSRYASDGKKNAEFVKSIVRDLTQLLNKFYKDHKVDVRIKEEVLNEIGLWRIDQYTNSDKGLVPGRFSTVKNEKDKEKKRALEKDLAQTLNGFWKRWSIPYRIDITKIER